MTAHDQEDLRQHVRRYLYVFYALLFGNHAINIAVALAIACGKAFLVAGFFMHLISERKMIYGLLAFTGFFFLGLMFLTISAYADFPRMTITH
jgi:caa(3)-type oxidase subunit IV